MLHFLNTFLDSRRGLWRKARLVFLLSALGVAGCKSGSSTVIDLTVLPEAVLALETISITVRAPGKSPLQFDRPAASMVLTNIFVSDLRDGTVVNLEVGGIKNLETIVVARAQVALILGERVAVTVRLAADCVGSVSLTCRADETCVRGLCIAVSSPRDGGMGDPDSGGSDVSVDVSDSGARSGGSGGISGGSGGTAGGGGGAAGSSGGTGGGTGGAPSGAGGASGGAGAAGRTGSGGSGGTGGAVGGRPGGTGGASGGAAGGVGGGINPAALTIAPTTTAMFPNTVVNATSASQSFSVTNTGGLPAGTASAPALALTGLSAADFDIISTTCSGTLAPSSTCAVLVAFNPASSGAKSAILTVSASPGGQSSVTITGTAVAPLTLTVVVAGTGSGMVGFSGGAVCTRVAGTCQQQVRLGDMVTLTATPEGQTNAFTGWSGDCTGTTPTCAITISGNANVTANFAPTYDLSVRFERSSDCGTPNGAEVYVATNIAGLSLANCTSCSASVCHARFVAGTQLSVTAFPASHDGAGTGRCSDTSQGTATLANPAIGGSCTANTAGGGFSTSPATCGLTMDTNRSIVVYSCQQSG